MRTCHPAYTGSNRLYILLPFLSSWTYLILFSFHLSVSFIISSFVFSFIASHLLLSLLLPYALFICLSPYFWPFQCKILSPPWFQVLNGCELVCVWGGRSEGQEERCLLGKSLLKESEKIRKESKGWVHEARHVCSPAGFKRRHFNRLNADFLTTGEAAIWEFATSKSEFQARPLCLMSTVHRQVITSIKMCVLSVLFLRITFHLLINDQHKAPCWTQPNRYTQQKYKDMAVPPTASTFQNANLVRSTGCKYHPNVSRRPQKSN